ncbi:MAG: hypothetical protein M1608_08445, partial [Candidatus Omnitrophica bacterium]|nr:hypothetical protein [Candidatus Omnitrophota bacterium]
SVIAAPSADDVACGLGLNRLEVLKWLEILAARGEIEMSRHEGQVYYRANAIPPRHQRTDSSCRPGKPTTSP